MTLSCKPQLDLFCSKTILCYAILYYDRTTTLDSHFAHEDDSSICVLLLSLKELFLDFSANNRNQNCCNHVISVLVKVFFT